MRWTRSTTSSSACACRIQSCLDGTMSPAAMEMSAGNIVIQIPGTVTLWIATTAQAQMSPTGGESSPTLGLSMCSAQLISQLFLMIFQTLSRLDGSMRAGHWRSASSAPILNFLSPKSWSSTRSRLTWRATRTRAWLQRSAGCALATSTTSACSSSKMRTWKLSSFVSPAVQRALPRQIRQR